MRYGPVGLSDFYTARLDPCEIYCDSTVVRPLYRLIHGTDLPTL